MIDIEGDYHFYGWGPYLDLDIHKVMADGTFDGRLLDWDPLLVDVPFAEEQARATVIHGSFDAATNKVQFSDGGSPGETLFTAVFMGYVIPTLAGGQTSALAGTWSAQRLSYGPGRTFNGVVYDNGGWYASIHDSPW